MKTVTTILLIVGAVTQLIVLILTMKSLRMLDAILKAEKVQP